MRDLLKVIESDEKKYLRVPYIITGIEMTKKSGVKLGFKDSTGLIDELGVGTGGQQPSAASGPKKYKK